MSMFGAPFQQASSTAQASWREWVKEDGIESTSKFGSGKSPFSSFLAIAEIEKTPHKPTKPMLQIPWQVLQESASLELFSAPNYILSCLPRRSRLSKEKYWKYRELKKRLQRRRKHESNA
jgi:hypothetical protein